MIWSFWRSLVASFFCLAPVTVREDPDLLEEYFGTLTRVRWVPFYVIQLQDIHDRDTFRHEVYHIRILEMTRLKAPGFVIDELRSACRNLADTDPDLSDLLKNSYDENTAINSEDEPIVRIIERPDLREQLPMDVQKQLNRICRPALLQTRLGWFGWLVVAGIAYQLYLFI